MASLSSWQANKIHGSEYLLTEVLRDQMDFEGLLISDWNGLGHVKGCTNERCARSINAGIDMLRAPKDWSTT